MLLAACSEQDVVDVPIPTTGKTPIELSVGGVDAPTLTRAVVTDGTTNTNFGRDTKVFFLMQSDKDATVHDGYEYKGDRATTLYTVARGSVVHATSPTDIVFDANNQKYWDDAHARSSQLTLWAFAQRIATNTDRNWPDYSFQSYASLDESHKMTYNSNNKYDWQSTTPIYPAIFTWNVGNLTQNQDANTIIYQDLLFSNNIADYTDNTKVPEGSRTDNRMKFNFSTHKFPESTELKFYHAMSKITIQIKAGDGFKADGTDFKLKNNNIDLLHGFNTRGLFNIKDGEFQKIHDVLDITTIPLVKTVVGKSEPYYTLEALAVPNIHQFLKTYSQSDVNSRFVDGSDNVMMQLTIDDNTYKITSDALFDAITGKTNATTLTDKGTYVPLEAGKNYVFTFTIAKQKIVHITAQVADWENVVAEEFDPSNARITLNLEERGTDLTSSDRFSLYRAKDNIGDSDPINDAHEVYNWTTGYNETGTTPSYVEAASPKPAYWTTTWYWESNKHFYHFRALAKDNGTTKEAVSSINQDVDNGDYYSLTSAASYNDILWGAPMLDNGENEDKGTFKWHYGPTTKGFDASDGGTVATGLPDGTQHQIYKAIGPTKDPVKLILFHIMSDLTFNIKTTDGTDKVELCHDNGAGADPRYTHTRLDLVGFYNGGKVLLGSGLVKTTGSASTVDSRINVPFNSATDNNQYTTQVYKFGAVPQDLTAVKLYVTTPDNNQYIIDLKDVKATTISTNNIANPYNTVGGTGADKDKYVIDRWYPGFKYTYTFTLRKTGITDIQATIVDWETVTADSEDVQIR